MALGFTPYQPEQDEGVAFCPVAQPLSILPEPPVPKIIQSTPTLSSETDVHVPGESLNPDVPEFIPNSVVNMDGLLAKPVEVIENAKSEATVEKPTENKKVEKEQKKEVVKVNGESKKDENVWEEVLEFKLT